MYETPIGDCFSLAYTTTRGLRRTYFGSLSLTQLWEILTHHALHAYEYLLNVTWVRHLGCAIGIVVPRWHRGGVLGPLRLSDCVDS